MAPKVNKFKAAHLGAVAFGLSKAAPTGIVRDPAEEIQTGVAEDTHMYQGEHTLPAPNLSDELLTEKLT